MTKDEALKYIIPFGKHKGRPFGEVYAEEPLYFEWCIENMDEMRWKTFFVACEAFGLLG